MCRWFAYLSPTEECILDDVLITPKHSLSRQVNDHYLPKLIHHGPSPADITAEHEAAARNIILNIDGLGVAWYTPHLTAFSADPYDAGLRPALYKTISPPLVDFNFRSICQNTATRVCFAHIRAATATACTPVNNHPFCHSRHTFMHNGTVADFVKIKRDVSMLLDEDVHESIQGTTDSEHLAALYMTHLTEGKGREAWDKRYQLSKMRAALNKTIESIITLQKQKGIADANSLNLAVTDGEVMLAYRYRNHATEQPPSLYYSTTAGVTLNRKYEDRADGVEEGEELDPEEEAKKKSGEEHGRHVIVASEPTTYRDEDWELIPKNHCVVVERDGSHSVEQIEIGV